MSKSRIFALVLLGCTSVLVPLSAHAADARPAHADITITWNGELNRAHGIRSGHGTMMDPYIISGWTVGNINIRDTDRVIKILNNTITGTLTLNWVGPDTVVKGNDIGDLRVNENIPRWGMPTTGHIDHNTFGTVGQLRHYDGTFSYNTVGTPQSGTLSSSYPDTRAVNFDGFNGAHFTHNTIYGYVDARLHGHHHSSGYGMPSHMHSEMSHDEMVDHTKRYHEVFISANKIYSSAAYALAYLDTDHAGNDRTANSETNPYLNAPHIHYTRVHITSNSLYGAGILIDVFNARDERHKGTGRGALDILSNRVTLERDMAHPFKVIQGIEVRQARVLSLRINSNVITGPAALAEAPAEAGAVPLPKREVLEPGGAGILLNNLDAATISIASDRVTNRQIGVQGLQLSRTVHWTISGLVTDGVDQPVAYDGSVANPPTRK